MTEIPEIPPLRPLTGQEVRQLVDEATSQMPPVRCQILEYSGVGYYDIGTDSGAVAPTYDSIELDHPERGIITVYRPAKPPLDHGYVRGH